VNGKEGLACCMCSSQTHALFVLWMYSVTFCIPNGTVAQARHSFSNPMKVFYMKPFVLMQPPSSKSTFAIQRRISWKNMRRNVKNVAHPFWIVNVNLWPGGLLWNTNGWVRNRMEMSEKCWFMVWKCDYFWCVFYTAVCIQNVLFISSFHLSKDNTTWCFDIKSILYNKKV